MPHAPQRQIGPPRRPGAGVAMALAHGAAHAYRHRAVVAHVAHRAKAYVKKTFSRKTTTRKVTRKADHPDTGTGSEITKCNISFGKASKSTLPKVLQACVQTVACRMTAANQYDNSASATVFPGVFALQNYQNNGTGATYLPVVVFDVTSWFNNIGGSLQYANTTWGATSDTSGNITWTSSYPWVLENTAAPSSSTATVPNASDLLKSINMKMLFYGASAKPSKIAIDLISIKDDYLHPDSTDTSTSTNGNVNYGAQRSAFWQTLIRPYMYTPLVTGDAFAVKGHMKTHQHTEFLLQEKLSNEPGGNFVGHMKMVNYQLNLNKIQRYGWQDQNLASAAQLEGPTMVTNISNPGTVVAPRSRLYVMIRAQSTFNNSASVDTTKGCSFDVVMKGTHQNVV